MKGRYRIGLFSAFLIMVVLIEGAYQLSYNHAKREFTHMMEAEAERKTAVKETQILEADGTAQKEDTYYLAQRNGYVVVYLSDRKTVYEYTSIELSHLPEELQKEIQAGKEISGEQRLYGFLENYSS